MRNKQKFKIVNKINLWSPKGDDLSLTGFTFVELMVITIILSVGLVFVLTGFITAIDVFNSSRNYLEAVRFLNEKMFSIEAPAKLEGGVIRETQKGNFASEERKFNWELTIDTIKDEEDLIEDLNEVNLMVNWQERNIPKDLSVVTYFKNKQE